MNFIAYQHLKGHGLSTIDYRKLFPNASLVNPGVVERTRKTNTGKYLPGQHFNNGRKHTIETKTRIGDVQRGVPKTKEHIANLIIARSNQPPPSEATCKKISEAKKNPSLETRERLRNTNLGRDFGESWKLSIRRSWSIERRLDRSKRNQDLLNGAQKKITAPELLFGELTYKSDRTWYYVGCRLSSGENRYDLTFRPKGLKPDWICPEERICVQVDGCHYHHCVICYPFRNLTSKDFFAKRSSDIRQDYLCREQGYLVVRVRECQLIGNKAKEIKPMTSEELETHIKESIVSELNLFDLTSEDFK
jgi:G:T-mismatch repair DNA endonuclease (very short patch repair protein)